MGAQGTIKMGRSSKICSSRIGKFEWFLNKAAQCTHLQDGQRCSVLNCCPANDHKTILWECIASGTFFFMAENGNKEASFHLWHGQFGNSRNHIHVHWSVPPALNAKRSITSSDDDVAPFAWIQIKIQSSLYVDISDRKNPLVEDSSDIVKLKIEGQKFYLSRKVLRAHSPIFHLRFKKRASYELMNVKLEEFLHFLGVVYNLHVTINKNTIEYLLQLGDRFQCRAVLRRCEEFLESTDVEDIPLADKLRFGDIFMLHETVADAVENMSNEELKALPRTHLSSFTLELVGEKLALI
ncbi:hypothetical protein L596_001098 [Steinernema carpocapsae]|uniref:BTB domain-containing protein n=1 Tax=Steinernema carpocapsae TaxID=34508 RepID=A0A4U8UJZ0_STECR|nr:hypothetical protein L596_001098 [Steinernema carpocapsae]